VTPLMYYLIWIAFVKAHYFFHTQYKSI